MYNSPGHKADILIDNNGRACLSDFSLLTIAAGQSTDVSSLVEGGSMQWMSPELIYPEAFGLTETRPTKESDCYALGMVICEIISGQTPFTPWKSVLVLAKVLEGVRPSRPEGKRGALFTDDIWRMLELCWKHQPSERTNAKVVLQCLERTSLLLRPSSDMGGIAGMDIDELLDVAATDSGIFSQFRRRSQTDLQSLLWYNRYNDYT